MIRAFDYRNNVAVIESDTTGRRWQVRLGIVGIPKGSARYVFDFGTLLQYRRVNPISSQADAQAAYDLVSSWDHFEEQECLLDLIKLYKDNAKSNAALIRDAAIRELYGIIDGETIVTGILSGKISERIYSVITHKEVAELVNYLLREAPGVASAIYPYPNNPTNAYRAVKQRFKKVPQELNRLLKDAGGLVFAAFRVASYLEKKRYSNKHFSITPKGGKPWVSMP